MGRDGIGMGCCAWLEWVAMELAWAVVLGLDGQLGLFGLTRMNVLLGSHRLDDDAKLSGAYLRYQPKVSLDKKEAARQL